MSTDKQDFVARVTHIVLAGMPADASDHDVETVPWSAECAWNAGADLDDAVRYCRTFEEVCPELEEEEAFRIRAELRAKYEGKARDTTRGNCGLF